MSHRNSYGTDPLTRAPLGSERVDEMRSLVECGGLLRTEHIAALCDTIAALRSLLAERDATIAELRAELEAGEVADDDVRVSLRQAEKYIEGLRIENARLRSAAVAPAARETQETNDE